jgi:hypothetical protein
MAEFVVIFSIVAAGSLVRWSIGFAFKRLAIKAAGEAVEVVSKGPWSGAPDDGVDPIARVGFILTSYGVIVLALVSAVPGELPLERTAFAFALLCVGGLVGEISGAGVTTETSAPEAGRREQPDETQTGETSRPLSVALAVTLNVSIALLTANQGLIQIVPLDAFAHSDRLDPVIVVAKRSHDPLESDSDTDFSGL